MRQYALYAVGFVVAALVCTTSPSTVASIPVEQKTDAVELSIPAPEPMREVAPIPVPSSLTEEQQEYLDVVRKAYPELKQEEDDTLLLPGRVGCYFFAGGGTPAELADTIRTKGHPYVERTYYMLGYGTMQFCPEYTQQIEELARWL